MGRPFPGVPNAACVIQSAQFFKLAAKILKVPRDIWPFCEKQRLMRAC